MIHFRTTGGYACGVGRRWSSQQITSTTSRRRVTCRGCTRTHVYLVAAPADGEEQK